MPVTVPSKPTSGHSATQTLIVPRNWLAWILTSEIMASRTRWAFQEPLSARASQRLIASLDRRGCCVEKKISRSTIHNHMMANTTATRYSTGPPNSRKSRMASHMSMKPCSRPTREVMPRRIE